MKLLDDNKSSYIYTACIVCSLVVAVVISVALEIESTLLTTILVFALVAIGMGVINAFSSMKEKTKKKEAEKQKRERMFNEREALLAGACQPQYDLLPPIPVSRAKNYEEKCWKEAYKEYVTDKNNFIKVKQYNEFVRNEQTKLRKLNETLGYDLELDMDKLPKEKSFKEQYDEFIKKRYLPKNFFVLNNFFVENKKWNNFVIQISKICLSNGHKLVKQKIDENYKEFFNGTVLNVINIEENEFLLFFPCYIIYLAEKSLKVITYDEMQVDVEFVEEKCYSSEGTQYEYGPGGSIRWYLFETRQKLNFKWGNNKYQVTCRNIKTNNFSQAYDQYIQTFNDEENSRFFKNNFSLTEEEKNKIIESEKKELEERRKRARQELEDKREEVIACKESIDYVRLETPILKEEYNNKEEYRLNKAYIDYLNCKNEGLKIEQYNDYIDASKSKLELLNKKLHYVAYKDFDRLPKKRTAQTPKTIFEMMHNFKELYDYFQNKKEWKDFSTAISKCKINASQFLINSEIEENYAEFFKGCKILTIQMKRNCILLFLPCYLVEISSNGLEIVRYDKIKARLKTKDKKSDTKRVPNAKVVAEEYTYRNSDGSPDKRRKNNPIIYTVRYTFVSFAWKSHNIEIQCNDAELFVGQFEKYANIFKEGVNASIYLNLSYQDEELEVSKIVEKYNEQQRLENEKIKQKQKLEKQKKLEEEKRKAEEERLRKLAIIQKQKERNEEMLRKKEIEANALKLFGIDSEETDNDTEKYNDVKKQFDSPISVVSECLITNNVFKVKLRQEKNMDTSEYEIVFVDADKNVISAKRSVSKTVVGEETTVGVVLSSGIDFTTMKNCFMQIRVNGDLVDEISFKMNIAFYSDF